MTAQIIAQVASHIYGGTTINRIDEVLSLCANQLRKNISNMPENGTPDVEGYAKALIEKNVSMPSNP